MLFVSILDRFGFVSVYFRRCILAKNDNFSYTVLLEKLCLGVFSFPYFKSILVPLRVSLGLLFVIQNRPGGGPREAIGGARGPGGLFSMIFEDAALFAFMSRFLFFSLLSRFSLFCFRCPVFVCCFILLSSFSLSFVLSRHSFTLGCPALHVVSIVQLFRLFFIQPCFSSFLFTCPFCLFLSIVPYLFSSLPLFCFCYHCPVVIVLSTVCFYCPVVFFSLLFNCFVFLSTVSLFAISRYCPVFVLSYLLPFCWLFISSVFFAFIINIWLFVCSLYCYYFGYYL